MKNEMIITTEILSDAELDIVAGGTFTANKYKEIIYNQAGISTKYNKIERDQFYARTLDGNNKSISYAQANWAVEFWKKYNQQAGYEAIVHACRE